MYIQQSQNKYEWANWLKRLGWLGFLFFLVKGVVWLTLPLLMVYTGHGN